MRAATNRMLRSRGLKALLGSGLFLAIAHADPAASTLSSSSPTTVPQVTVEAQREHDLERQAHTFVENLTRGGRFQRESIALWRVPLCFLVGGLPKKQGELVLSRLSEDADSAGVRLARGSCNPNFLVMWSSEPDSLLKTLKARHPRMLGDGAPSEMQRFLHASQARVVRIWHNADVTNRNGRPLYEFGNGGCDRGFGGRGLSDLGPTLICPQNSDIIESRLSLDQLVVFSSVIIVVDKSLTRSATLEQLADFVALMGLVDIDPDVDVGDTPSILQLFKESAVVAPPGLTTWDKAFLRGLYHTDQTSRGQRLEVELTVARAVSH